MKKFYYLIAMAMMAFTFTSCEDVPEPFGQPINPNKGTQETILNRSSTLPETKQPAEKCQFSISLLSIYHVLQINLIHHFRYMLYFPPPCGQGHSYYIPPCDYLAYSQISSIKVRQKRAYLLNIKRKYNGHLTVYNKCKNILIMER